MYVLSFIIQLNVIVPFLKITFSRLLLNSLLFRSNITDYDYYL